VQELERPAIVTAAERPELAAQMQRLGGSPWPEFLDHDAVVNECWPSLYELVPEFQFAVLDGDELVAVGNAVPFPWDGTPAGLPDAGIDAVLTAGIAGARRGEAVTAASALMIVVRKDRLGRGLSGACIRAMAQVVSAQGAADLVAPVRPTLKHRYPLIPMERYAEWRRPDGSRFDPWLRVHERVGGEALGVVPAAMTVVGSVADWATWTGMAFPGSGRYVVPGGLVPVEVDVASDEGRYVEPGYWMRHRCGA
jgi:GNAT superfamily N-acetyltransferase